MTTFHIISIFPEAFESYFGASILKRGQEKKLIKIKFHNPRNFAEDKHKSVDDSPYGGGPGMVMKLEPILKAIKSISKFNPPIGGQKTKVILFSARGKQFTSKKAREFSKNKEIILICGHYEGIDDRLKKILKDMGFRVEEISIGPYILSGGEAATLVLVDAVSRHIPGVLGKIESLEEKKGSYPTYTRPEVFEFKNKNYSVPKVLLSGDHKEIFEWRLRHGKKV